MKERIQLSANLIAFILIFFIPTIGQGQQLDYHQGQVIVQLEEGLKGENWVKQWQEIQGEVSGLIINKQLSRPANIYLLDFNYTQIHDELLLRLLKSGKGLIYAQFNHFVQMRSEPNDEFFSSQWQYINTGQSGGTPDADIDADLAWDLTTGGVTLTGDTIVVAVLDNGVDTLHEDFQRNRWVNHAEIPNNGLDDDGNGYVDDYLGWSIVTDSDNISGGSHGTPVAGIIGADGNNEIGVTGVNWHVKVMIIKNNFNTNEAAVLSAYSYALEQRVRYNESGGSAGAFVVATNASWGIDNGDPDDAPIWCAFYDTLGEAGILSCGATANAHIDVDEDGDLPTACSSDYLIAVTNINHNDMILNQAGFGLETIDLGAFGANTYTLDNGNNYDGFGGTSGATPHVTGAIGLLYSLECPQLMGLAQVDPAAAALLVKAAILNGTDPNTSLEGITVTGGRLNIMGSMNQLLPNCGGCIPASSVDLSGLTDVFAQLNWNTNDSLASVDIRWRAIGEAEWALEENAQSPLAFNALFACQDYEYQVQSNCHSDTLAFGNSRFFQTDGCCLPPEDVTLSFETTELVSFSWNSILAAQSYEFAYRIVGTTDWATSTITDTTFTIGGIGACENYEYRVRTICMSETTDWTTTQTFITQGCGPCLDLNYCVPENYISTEEFIERVEIEGLLDNISTVAPGGYTDYGSTVPFINIEQGGEYFVRFTPGFTGNSFSEAWRVWLDMNHSGGFTSSPTNNEVIFFAPSSNEVVDGFIQIPADAMLGVTRMRVLMQFSAALSPCAFSEEYGEIEDYCINIIPTTACINPDVIDLQAVDTTSATVIWNPVGPAVNYEMAYRLSSEADWTAVSSNSVSAELENLQICSDYVFRIKTICTQEDGQGYATFDFSTNCTTATQTIKANAQNWRISPNPFHSTISLQWSTTVLKKEIRVVVQDAFGQEAVAPQQWSANQAKLTLNLDHLPAAVYTVSLIKNGQLWSTKRVVKMN